MWRGLTSFPPVYWYFWTWTCCQVISQIVTKCSPNRCDLLANINTYVLLNCCFYSPKNICHGVWWLHMLNRFILYPNLNHWPNKTLAYQIEYATIQFLFFFLIFPFFILDSMSGGERQRGRGKQALCWAGNPILVSVPGPRSHDLSQRQMSHLSHPGTPSVSFFCFVFTSFAFLFASFQALSVCPPVETQSAQVQLSL